MILRQRQAFTCEERSDGQDGLDVGVCGHVHRGHISQTHTEEGQHRREGHVPHGERDGIGEAIIRQDPLVVQDDCA